MSVLEPGGGDADVLAALEAQLTDIEEPTDVEDVTKLQPHELTLRLQHIDSKLSSMKQLLHMNPDTQEARDLHSQRVALLAEMARRGLR